jgi:hypothetical protein
LPTAEQRPLSSWVRRLVYRELADRVSDHMDAEERANAAEALAEQSVAKTVKLADDVSRQVLGKPLAREHVPPRLKKDGK